MAKNITLTVDEDVIQSVRQYASARRTSVNALVRGFLADLVRKDQEADDARADLLALIDKSEGDMGDRGWSREALYDR